MKVSVYSWVWGIWVLSTSFQKSNIGWPQQPLKERVTNISGKLDFCRSISKNRTNIGYFGARNVQTITTKKFFEKIGLWRLVRPVRLKRLLRSMRLQRFLRPKKITSEYFSVIQVHELNNLRTNINLFWIFERKKIFDRIMKITLNFSTFSVGGCWGQSMLLFWKLSNKSHSTCSHISYLSKLWNSSPMCVAYVSLACLVRNPLGDL